MIAHFGLLLTSLNLPSEISNNFIRISKLACWEKKERYRRRWNNRENKSLVSSRVREWWAREAKGFFKRLRLLKGQTLLFKEFIFFTRKAKRSFLNRLKSRKKWISILTKSHQLNFNGNLCLLNPSEIFEETRLKSFNQKSTWSLNLWREMKA